MKGRFPLRLVVASVAGLWVACVAIGLILSTQPLKLDTLVSAFLAIATGAISTLGHKWFGSRIWRFHRELWGLTEGPYDRNSIKGFLLKYVFYQDEKTSHVWCLVFGFVVIFLFGYLSLLEVFGVI